MCRMMTKMIRLIHLNLMTKRIVVEEEVEEDVAGMVLVVEEEEAVTKRVVTGMVEDNN